MIVQNNPKHGILLSLKVSYTYLEYLLRYEAVKVGEKPQKHQTLRTCKRKKAKPDFLHPPDFDTQNPYKTRYRVKKTLYSILPYVRARLYISRRVH